MTFDNHMHTIFSSDSTMSIEEVLGESKSKNLAVTLTEHLDLNNPEPGEFKCDVEKYLETYGPYRNENLKLGIEIGFSMNFIDEYNKIINSNDFDFVIGSIHSVNDLDIFTEFQKRDGIKDEVYIEYLEAMEEAINAFDCFDVLGHIDYICRYAPYEDKELHFEVYEKHINKVLKALISKGKVLELNTRRLNNKVAYDSLYKIYYRYKKLGGKYVTLGSDAHKASDIGVNFQLANDFINSLGLKAVYFENRIMKY